MVKFLVLISALLSPPCLGWNVSLEPYDHIPMYAEQNLSVRLFLEAGDQEVTQPLTLSLRLSEDQSWAVSLLTDSITFDYTDIRYRGGSLQFRAEVIGNISENLQPRQLL